MRAPSGWPRPLGEEGPASVQNGEGQALDEAGGPPAAEGRAGDSEANLKWHPARRLGRPPLPAPRSTSRGPPDPESSVLSAPSVNTSLPASPAQPNRQLNLTPGSSCSPRPLREGRACPRAGNSAAGLGTGEGDGQGSLPPGADMLPTETATGGM